MVGWDVKDASTSGQAYAVLTAGDVPVGGLMNLPEEGLRMGATPRWVGCVAVDDMDVTAATDPASRWRHPRATDRQQYRAHFGGRRSAKATFALIAGLTYGGRQPGGLMSLRMWAGTSCWLKNRNTVFDFYGGLFGWQKANSETDPADLYQLFSVAGQTIGGMLTKLPSVYQPCWIYYFNVDDIVAAAKRVNAGGGRVLQGPVELPDGCWIVRCADPQGALFALQGARAQRGVERSSASEVGWSAKRGGHRLSGQNGAP